MFSVFIKTNRTELEGRWEFFKYGIVAIFGSQPMFLAVHTTGSELTVVACSGFYGRFSSSNRPIFTLRQNDVTQVQPRKLVAKDNQKNVVLCCGMPESEICKQGS